MLTTGPYKPGDFVLIDMDGEPEFSIFLKVSQVIPVCTQSSIFQPQT